MGKVFLFNPYTGTPRHPSDIASDPEGLAIVDDTEPLRAALAATPAQPKGDWRKPVPLRDRFAQAVALLCGTAAPDDMIDGWLGSGDDRLQAFAAEHGPAWAQGIVLLDAARVLAATPVEGVDHEAATPAPAPLTDEQIEEALNAGGIQTQRFMGGIARSKDVWTTAGSADIRKIAAVVRKLIAAPHPDTVDADPVAWLYTLEYGANIADRKVSLEQLRYPFGVCGADYLRANADGVSYVRETPLHAARAQAQGGKP